MNSAQVAVGGTPVVLAAAGDWQRVIVANRHATGALFLGRSTVTITTGFEVPVGVTLPIWILLGPGQALYGVAAVASTAHVLVTS